MAIKAVQAKITLGDIILDVYQLPDGSYAAPGLFRLSDTDIYRYEEYWYWVNPDGPPALEEYRCWDWDKGAFLSLQGNRLSYLYMDPVDPERDIGDDNVEISYRPVPNDVIHAIDFCVTGRLVSEETIRKLLKMYDGCYSGDLFERAANRAFLLRDTAQDLPKSRVRGITSKDKNSSGTPKKPRVKIPKARVGVIYLAKLDGHLKLGFTQNLNKRLDSFKTTNARVELVNSVKGTLCQEKRLHSKLGSKVRELYYFEDEQKILKEMALLH
jgi:hypothetical protein